MEQLSVPRSYELNFRDGKDLDDWSTVPYNANFVLEYEYPNVPSFTEDLTGAPYFTAQPPKQYGVGFGYSPVEGGEYLPVQPAIDDGHLFETDMGLNNGYIVNNSYQSVEAPLASPASVGSSIENSPWDVVEPVQHEPIWDLSTLHPDSCSISDAEPFDWSGASSPKAHFQGDRSMQEKLEESAALLRISLADSFRFPCGHKTCTKSFKRKEHAKRHYLTKHKPNRFRLQCEFCGKDTFTRRDNLNAHRRLHARNPPKQSSGVHFVPAALEAFQRRRKPAPYNQKFLHLAP
ncbi:zinc finger odd-paired-like (opl) [Fusarium pseudocircinatum]|uniref:Zinc finger odd-paired-like (Opl) n=1 Tax=Fusarium pseudocircinatum TaxID=56676 RepID=A0A8H5PRE0_9HYPO|nr:zinc finger odd-paired-like (opl) [Fusarium pseudocircinatum]